MKSITYFITLANRMFTTGHRVETLNAETWNHYVETFKALDNEPQETIKRMFAIY